MWIINLHDEYERKAVITLCLQVSSPLSWGQTALSGPEKSAGQAWRPALPEVWAWRPHKDKGTRCLHISRSISLLVYLAQIHKWSMLPETLSRSARKGLANFIFCESQKRFQHNFLFLSVPHQSSLSPCKNNVNIEHELHLLNQPWLHTELVPASLDFTATSAVWPMTSPESLFCN